MSFNDMVWQNTQLLGFLLHKENYNGGSRAVADMGWRLFAGNKDVMLRPEVSLEEAIWLVERGRLSQSIYEEVRLRFLNRIKFPPADNIRRENKVHRPIMVELPNGVKVSLASALSLTITERLEVMDLTGIDLSTAQ